MPFLKPLCGPNMEYKKCSSSCPLTCSNVDDPPTNCAESCIPKCSCKSGYVLDGDKCVEPSACPCLHGGNNYYEGDTLKLDCNNWYAFFFAISVLNRFEFYSYTK